MWPNITYETCAWDRDYEELMLIPKSRRRKILPTYEAAVPAKIAQLTVSLSPELQKRLTEIETTEPQLRFLVNADSEAEIFFYFPLLSLSDLMISV